MHMAKTLSPILILLLFMTSAAIGSVPSEKRERLDDSSLVSQEERESNLSPIHQKMLEVILHISQNARTFENDALLVREVYLENNRLLPRYKNLLLQRLYSGAIGTLLTNSTEFLPGDIHAFSPPKGRSKEPLLGIHVVENQFITVRSDGTIFKGDLQNKKWRKRLLSSRRIFTPSTKGYVTQSYLKRTKSRLSSSIYKRAAAKSRNLKSSKRVDSSAATMTVSERATKSPTKRTAKSASLMFLVIFSLSLSFTLFILRPRADDLSAEADDLRARADDLRAMASYGEGTYDLAKFTKSPANKKASSALYMQIG